MGHFFSRTTKQKAAEFDLSRQHRTQKRCSTTFLIFHKEIPNHTLRCAFFISFLGELNSLIYSQFSTAYLSGLKETLGRSSPQDHEKHTSDRCNGLGLFILLSVERPWLKFLPYRVHQCRRKEGFVTLFYRNCKIGCNFNIVKFTRSTY